MKVVADLLRWFSRTQARRSGRQGDYTLKDIREFRGYREGFHPYNQKDNYATYAKNLWQSSGEFSPMCSNLDIPYDFSSLPEINGNSGLKSIQIVRRNDGTYNTIQIPDISLAEGVAIEDTREMVYFGVRPGNQGFVRGQYETSLSTQYTDDITYQTFDTTLSQPPSVILPALTNAPGSGDADTTLVATYITPNGDESAASFASQVFAYTFGDSTGARIRLPLSAPVNRVRVYMSVGGVFRLVYDEPVSAIVNDTTGNNPVTNVPYREITVTGIELDPNLSGLNLQEWAAPPLLPLHNLINISGGRIAGVSSDSRSVWISDPENPISFPFRIPMANRVVRIIRSGEDLLVLTDGRPSVITGYEVPREQELDFNEPCVSANSVVDMGFSIMYASPNGICAIERYSGSILTMDNRYDGNIEILDVKKWQKRPIETIKATSYQGRYIYYMTTGNGTWTGTAFNTQYGELIDMPDLGGEDIFFVKNPSTGKDDLDIYSRVGTQLTAQRFMAGEERLLGEWVRDLEVLESEPVVYSRVQANEFEGCTVTVDGLDVPVTDDRHFTVKSSNRKRVVRHGLKSSRDIQSLKLGHAIESLY